VHIFVITIANNDYKSFNMWKFQRFDRPLCKILILLKGFEHFLWTKHGGFWDTIGDGTKPVWQNIKTNFVVVTSNKCDKLISMIWCCVESCHLCKYPCSWLHNSLLPFGKVQIILGLLLSIFYEGWCKIS